MPRWLAQMGPWLFDNQNPEDARVWEQRFYAELKPPEQRCPILHCA